MKNKISDADLKMRFRVLPHELHRGSVVAYSYDYVYKRTGIIVMEDRTMMLAALNFDDEGKKTIYEFLPEDIELYEANEEEKLWGYEQFLFYNYEDSEPWEGCISLVENECPRDDDDIRKSFCYDFILHIPKLVERSQWGKMKSILIAKLGQIGGLQFNRLQAELYCLLLGVLMIAECTKDERERLALNKLFVYEWNQFSWMYGICLGRIVGSRLHNFTGVVNQIRNNERKYYLHLYIPLIDRYFDKIIEYNDDKPEKLRNAINKAKKIEEMEEQRENLDLLFGILFPGIFHDAMSSSRPAASIAEMRKEMEAKEQYIKKLEDAVDDMSNKYKNVLEQLTNAVNEVETDKISADDLTAAFLRFPPELALSFFGSMSTLLAQNPTWQKYAPQINNQILAKTGSPSTINVQGDYVLNKHVENEVGNVENGATGIKTDNRNSNNG